MTAERVYQQLWRVELSRRFGLEFVEVAAHEQLEIKGWEDKTLRDGFSKRAAQVRAQCDAWGTTDTRTAREAARATRRAKNHSETEEVIYDRWGAELAEHGIGERTYAERVGRATGHTLTEDEAAALLEALASPEGLTAQASTFARRDVVDQLARRLPVATSATAAMEELEGLADRFLAERAVGDRVVCGKNALKRLGVANGTRGTVVALDRDARSLTIQIGDNADAKRRGAADGDTETLPAHYLDGKGRPGAPRRVDLAYATTGHKSQGLTKWTSLPFVSGREDAQWLYVVLSRARHLTRIYTVTGPEERPPELAEVPNNRRAPDGYERLAAAMGRDRGEQLASDVRRLVDLRAMPTRELRRERDRLDDALGKARRARQGATRSARRHATATTRPSVPPSGRPNANNTSASSARPERMDRSLRPRPGWRTRRASRPASFAGISSNGPAGWRLTPNEDLGQRRAWQAARTTIERFHERTHSRDNHEREAG
jgi:hypothetical protein